MSANPDIYAYRSFIARLSAFATLLALLCAVAGCATPAPAAAASDAPPLQVVTVEVPVTVEVTRVAAPERVVPATPEPPAPCAPDSLADAQEIVVGVLLPSSLANALPTVLPAQSGLVIAASELAAQQGDAHLPIRLWWADTANSPETGAARAEEAIFQQCAVALISASNSETSAAIDQVAQRWSTPLLVVDGMDDTLSTSQSPTLFRLTPGNSMVANAYANWASAVGDYNGDGSTHAAVVYENNDWARLQAELIAAAMQAMQIEVDLYPVDLPAADYSSLIARMVVKQALPDTIFLRIAGDPGLQLHKQLLDNGVGPTRKSLIVTARSITEMPAFWSTLGENGAWSVITRTGAWHGTTSDASTAFVDAYARLLGRWPEITAFAAHDALLLIADAIGRAQSLDGEALVDAIAQSDVTLAGGHYSFEHAAAGGQEVAEAPWAWHQWLEQPILFLQLTAPGQSLDDAAVLWPPEYAGAGAAFLRGE